MIVWLAQKTLFLLGWRLEGAPPEYSRAVVIAAPHTSNWDFPLLLLFAVACNLKIRWMAKHSLFTPPLGFLFRAIGGIAIKRDRKNNIVANMIDMFITQKKLLLVIPVEGTRSYAEHWKSGFYHIAHGANVPILPSYLDYGSKQGGFGPEIHTTGNIAKDMSILRAFYAPIKGKFPSLAGRIKLREEQ